MVTSLSSIFSLYRGISKGILMLLLVCLMMGGRLLAYDTHHQDIYATCGQSYTYQIVTSGSPVTPQGQHQFFPGHLGTDVVTFVPCEENTKQISVNITVPYWGTIYNGSMMDYVGGNIGWFGNVIGVYTGQIPGKITSSARDGALSFEINRSGYTTVRDPLYAPVTTEFGWGAACGGGQTCVSGLSCEGLLHQGPNVCWVTTATCEEAPGKCDVLDSMYLGYNDQLSDYFGCNLNGRLYHIDNSNLDTFISAENLQAKQEGCPSSCGLAYEVTDASTTSAQILIKYPVIGDAVYKYIMDYIRIPSVYEGGDVDVPASQVTIYHRNQDGTCDTDARIYTTGGALDYFAYPYGGWDIPDDYEKLFYGLCVLVERDFAGYPGAVLTGAGKGIAFSPNDGANDSYAASLPFFLEGTYDPNDPICLCGNDILDSGEECDDSDDNGCLEDCSCDTGYTPNGTGGCTLDPGQVICGSADGKTYYTASPTDPKTHNNTRTYCSDNSTPTPTEFNGVYTWSCPDEPGCTATNLFCDDGKVNGAEACDDGDENDGTNQAGCAAGNVCTACSCSGPCGNGVWDDTEQCDYSVPGTQYCTFACTCMPGYMPNGSGNCVQLTKCGDGIIQSPEACDDGNNDNTDACTIFCRWATCGDGFVQNYATGSFGAGTGGEASCVGVCGTGTNMGSGCNDDKDCPMGGLLPQQPGSCLIFPDSPPGYCSNPLHTPCRTNADCGAYICLTQATVCPPETPNNNGCFKNGLPNGICEPGQGETSFTCMDDCPQIIPAYSEECDDGNTNNGDGCSSLCTKEIGWECGDGIHVPEAGEECDLGIHNGLLGGTCTEDCKLAECDPETIYASGSVPGWTCPPGYVLKGCDPYICVKMTYAPIQCFEPVCGNGILEPGEFCDGSDPNDPNKDICNSQCQRNFCGDGEISSGSVYTELIRNRDPTQATGLRAIIGSGKVITPGIGGFPTSPNTRELGGFFDLIPDIDQDGIAELVVSARGGYQYIPSLNSVSFDDQKNVDALRSYISSVSSYYPQILALTTLRDIDAVGDQGHPEVVYAPVGCSGSLTTLLVSAANPVYNPPTNVRTIDISPYHCSEVKQLTNIGDIDSNGIDDIAFIVNKTNPAPTSMEVAVVLLQDHTSMRMDLRTLTNLGIKRGDNTQILGGIASLGDTNGDGVPDLLVAGQAVGSANQLLVRRLLLTQDIQLQASSDVYKSFVNNGLRELFPHYLPDIDGDGVRDLAIVHDYKATDDTEVTLLRLKSDRTVNEAQTFDLGPSPDGGNDGIRLQDVSYITIASGGHLILGDKWAFPLGNGTSRGAIYLYPIQAPYAHYIQTTGLVESCDEGSFCDDLVTRCEDDPSKCPGGPSRCLPRYINGCTPTCQGGCGNGLLNPAGIDGILGTVDDEECDDGNGIDTDACTTQCKRPFCGDGILTYEAYWTGDDGMLTGYYEHCDPTITGQAWCPSTCLLTGNINGLCNYTFASHSVYGIDTFTGLNEVGHLCYPVGIQAIASGHTTGVNGDIVRWNWTCKGLNGGEDGHCSLARWSCGDGVVDKRSGMTTPEQCDDGNRTSGDGCDQNCQFEPRFTSPVLASSGLCTEETYPQVEEGELLPVWLQGTVSNHVTGMNGCASLTTNSLMRKSFLCDIQILRGQAGDTGPEVVGTGTIPCGELSGTGAALIADAFTDFTKTQQKADYTAENIVGSYLFNTGDLVSWITHNNVKKYGQYQLRVTQMRANYCAKVRTTDAGTVTGDSSAMVTFNEICDNNIDDNMDGFIDCADPFCYGAVNCSTLTGEYSYASGSETLTGFNGTGEICGNGSGENDDAWMDCADSECATYTGCISQASGGTNIACFNANRDPLYSDSDSDNSNYNACAPYYGTGHIPEPLISRQTHTTIYTGSSDKGVCRAGFSVSKGYFVQQGFAFSEQANTGLATTQYTSIGGVPFVAEGTAFDDDMNYLASYQGAGKQYLFNDFVNTRESKAVNTDTVGGYQFKKVPAHHIYFYGGNDTDTVIMSDFLRNSLLHDLGGIERNNTQKVSYTIVLPKVGQRLTIRGELLGNGMYISQGEIKFETVSCDQTDIVEGLFIAGSGFLTDTIGNRSLTAAERCRGGNLQIKGTLLGMNAGSALAPLRRSVLDAWSEDNLLFDNSLIYQAKELFETCYLPALAHKKGYVVNSNTGFTNYYGPLSGCNINTVTGHTEISQSVMTTFLNNFLAYILGNALTCGPYVNATDLCAPDINFVLPMMDKISNTTSPFVIPDNLTTINTEGITNTISLIPAKTNNFTGDTTTLLGKMQAEGRRFPAWWVNPKVTEGEETYNIDLTDPVHRQLMTQIVSRAFGDIKDAMVGFAPVNNTDTLKALTNAVPVVTGMSLISQKLGVIFGNSLYFVSASGQTDFSKPCTGCKLSGSNCDINSTFNKLFCNPDYKWFSANRGEGMSQGSTRTSRLIDGSSVVISSQPKLWTDLPPGAKEFLNTLVVVPR